MRGAGVSVAAGAEVGVGVGGHDFVMGKLGGVKKWEEVVGVGTMLQHWGSRLKRTGAVEVH